MQRGVFTISMENTLPIEQTGLCNTQVRHTSSWMNVWELRAIRDTDLCTNSMQGFKMDPKQNNTDERVKSRVYIPQQTLEMNLSENPPPVKRAQKDIWSWLHYSLTAGCLLSSFCLLFISSSVSAGSARPPLFSASLCLCLFSLIFSLSFLWLLPAAVEQEL